MVGDRVGAGLRHSLAFLREHMQKHRSLLILHVAQPAPERRQIVSVDRAEVAEAQFLEEHAAGEERLQAILELFDGMGGQAADEGNPAQQVADVPFGVLVKVGQAGAVEACRQGADARADRHLVVVENDQQVLLQPAGVVECLEDDTRRQGTITDDGDALSVFLAAKVVANLEPQRRRRCSLRGRS